MSVGGCEAMKGTRFLCAFAFGSDNSGPVGFCREDGDPWRGCIAGVLRRALG